MMPDVSFDGGRYELEDLPQAQVKVVDIADILGRTRTRYVIHTSKGSIVLKHISKRMKEHIDTIRYTRYPGLRALEQEARLVYPMAMTEDADPDTVKRACEIAAEMLPAQDLYMLGTIEYPFLTTPEEFDEFFEVLTQEEQEALRQMQTVLTAWGQKVDYTKLEMAQRFNITMVEQEHIRDPTYEQYVALYSYIAEENRQTEKLYRDMGVLK